MLSFNYPIVPTLSDATLRDAKEALGADFEHSLKLGAATQDGVGFTFATDKLACTVTGANASSSNVRASAELFLSCISHAHSLVTETGNGLKIKSFLERLRQRDADLAEAVGNALEREPDIKRSMILVTPDFKERFTIDDIAKVCQKITQELRPGDKKDYPMVTRKAFRDAYEKILKSLNLGAKFIGDKAFYVVCALYCSNNKPGKEIGAGQFRNLTGDFLSPNIPDHMENQKIVISYIAYQSAGLRTAREFELTSKLAKIIGETFRLGKYLSTSSPFGTIPIAYPDNVEGVDPDIRRWELPGGKNKWKMGELSDLAASHGVAWFLEAYMGCFNRQERKLNREAFAAIKDWQAHLKKSRIIRIQQNYDPNQNGKLGGLGIMELFNLAAPRFEMKKIFGLREEQVRPYQVKRRGMWTEALNVRGDRLVDTVTVELATQILPMKEPQIFDQRGEIIPRRFLKVELDKYYKSIAYHCLTNSGFLAWEAFARVYGHKLFGWGKGQVLMESVEMNNKWTGPDARCKAIKLLAHALHDCNLGFVEHHTGGNVTYHLPASVLKNWLEKKKGSLVDFMKKYGLRGQHLAKELTGSVGQTFLNFLVEGTKAPQVVEPYFSKIDNNSCKLCIEVIDKHFLEDTLKFSFSDPFQTFKPRCPRDEELNDAYDDYLATNKGAVPTVDQLFSHTCQYLLKDSKDSRVDLTKARLERFFRV